MLINDIKDKLNRSRTSRPQAFTQVLLTDYIGLKLSLNTPRGHICGVEVWFHSFLAQALDDSEWPASRQAELPSSPGEITGVHIEQEAGWATEQG
jgi:hypothetical protein